MTATSKNVTFPETACIHVDKVPSELVKRIYGYIFSLSLVVSLVIGITSMSKDMNQKGLESVEVKEPVPPN
jgi:hypothetical protein